MKQPHEKTHKTAPGHETQIISYMTLRKAVGWLGILLPFELVLGAFLFGCCCTIQPSISHYYFTTTRELLEGTMCAVSLFLFCYKGPEKWDSWTSNFAGLCAVSIALFHTSSDGFACQTLPASLFTFKWQNDIHLASGALFFITLALMSLFLFTKGVPKSERTLEKKKRNVIYIVCGILMLLCVAGMIIYVLSPAPVNETVFWLEDVALWAFGLSWLTKGEALFPDKPKVKPIVQIEES